MCTMHHILLHTPISSHPLPGFDQKERYEEKEKDDETDKEEGEKVKGRQGD